MGLHHLVLVNPQCDPNDPEAIMMAVHGVEILQSVQVVSSLAESLQGCYRVIGTTGRDQSYPPEWCITPPRVVMPWLASTLPGAIVFGPEDRGLNNEELALCQRHVMIPTALEYPSLNLAQAVGICCYELRLAVLDAWDQIPAAPQGKKAQSAQLDPAPIEVIEGFYHHLETILLKIGYLQPHTAKRKLEKFRTLFNRAELTLQEVALLRGILRKIGLLTKLE